MKLGRVAPLVVAVALLVVMLQGQPVGVARTEGSVGVIDLDAVWSHNLLPALEAPLADETARLQRELDREAAGKPEGEKQQIFDEYQSRLYAYQQQLVDELLAHVREVIGEVADELGLSVVLDANSVMFGGVDVTEVVLSRLNESAS